MHALDIHEVKKYENTAKMCVKGFKTLNHNDAYYE